MTHLRKRLSDKDSPSAKSRKYSTSNKKPESHKLRQYCSARSKSILERKEEAKRVNNLYREIFAEYIEGLQEHICDKYSDPSYLTSHEESKKESKGGCGFWGCASNNKVTPENADPTRPLAVRFSTHFKEVLNTKKIIESKNLLTAETVKNCYQDLIDTLHLELKKDEFTALHDALTLKTTYFAHFYAQMMHEITLMIRTLNNVEDDIKVMSVVSYISNVSTPKSAVSNASKIDEGKSRTNYTP